jgi:hypothetical protein
MNKQTRLSVSFFGFFSENNRNNIKENENNKILAVPESFVFSKRDDHGRTKCQR